MATNNNTTVSQHGYNVNPAEGLADALGIGMVSARGILAHMATMPRTGAERVSLPSGYSLNTSVAAAAWFRNEVWSANL
jgi:hypothetical protein